MTKTLTLDEMLDCIEIMGDTMIATVFKRQLEAIGDHMAQHLAKELKVDCGTTLREESAFAGTCCTFFPAAPGDPCPEPLASYDATQWEDDDDIPAPVSTAGYQVRHDNGGFFVCTDAEAEHEDAGHQSAGFDGRPHFGTIAEAWEHAGKGE